MKYYLGEEIGDAGGFGNVYNCYSETREQYAIKILKNNNEEAILRFQKEIRLTSRLDHPNIIRIIAYEAIGEKKYYIMPKYECSLMQVIPQLYNNYDRQYNVLTEILNGLVYLHEQGVLHRDLKPQNILYNSDTDIAISDLGFSRQVDSASDRLTRYGEAFGTQRYMSPEQFRNAEDVDERTDIYAFGKMLEDIVTNFDSVNVPKEELVYIIEKCTESRKDKRFSSARELKNAIDSVYKNILKITANGEVHVQLSNLERGALDFSGISNLALMLISSEMDDLIEKFFFSLSNEEYKQLEKEQLELLKNLVKKLKDYYTGQPWGFNYTDVIGATCRRYYELTCDGIIRAMFLYIILEVGISHNRYYVIGVAELLLGNINNNMAEAIELHNLLKKSPVSLSRLNISKDKLPEILAEHY